MEPNKMVLVLVGLGLVEEMLNNVAIGAVIKDIHYHHQNFKTFSSVIPMCSCVKKMT